jgi:hypothetical protein
MRSTSSFGRFLTPLDRALDSLHSMDVSVLQTKLPDVGRWVDNVVQQHRRFARPVTSLAFGRLPQYFQFGTLNRAFVVEVDVIPKPPLTALGLHQFEAFEHMDADGITYGDTYFIRRERAADEALHFHELVHIVQWQILGPERFILAYAVGLAGGGYSTNPFEQIAYALQDRFCSSAESFSVEPLVWRHVSQTMSTLSNSVSR